MDPFNKLPAELIQQILINSADFIGPESLIAVSPRAHAVFHAQPRYIVLNLLASNSITSFLEIHELCWNIAWIHDLSTACDSVGEYRRICKASLTWHEHLRSAQLCKVLHIAANIQRLTCLCLSAMHANFVAALPPSDAPQATAPFSWIETYRVSWALWHLQHYSDLHNMAKRHWTWSDASILELDSYLSWNEISQSLAEQIWTVAAVLVKFSLNPVYRTPNWRSIDPDANPTPTLTAFPDSFDDKPENEPVLPIWHYATKTPLPYFISLQTPQGQPSPAGPLFPSPPAPNNEDTPNHRYWGRSPVHGTRGSRQVGLLKSHGFRMRRQTPPNYALHEMRPFRQLGAIIWDPWRLYQVGLIDCNQREDVPTPEGGVIAGLGDGDFRRRVDVREMQRRWVALVGKEGSLSS
ncbi:hypothetical protein BJX99DRAFT_272907 [Aspergillus californicus]